MKSFNMLGDIINSEADRWYFSEVTPAQVAAFLKGADGEDVEININSNGGSVTGGIAIANMLKGYSGKVTCNVLGVAASIASVIACAGKTLAMGEGSFLMIHNPWAYTQGTAEDLRKDADTLDKMRDAIIAVYKGKCGGDEKDLKALMDAETWLSRDEAREAGFDIVDSAGGLKAAASLTRRVYDKAPEAAKALVQFQAEKPEKPEKPAEEPAPEEAPAEAPQTAQDASDAGEVGTPAPAEETPQNEPSAPQDEAQAAAPAQEPAEKPAPEAKKPSENWEARFKGLSQKLNDLQAQHKAALEAAIAERDNFKSQYDQAMKDLDAVNAKLSDLVAQVEEGAKTLLKANEDLAQTRDSLKAAEDKAAHLESTRDMLTAGVLTPPSVDNSYDAKMKAAKTAEEREALRAAKKAGKIK